MQSRYKCSNCKMHLLNAAPRNHRDDGFVGSKGNRGLHPANWQDSLSEVDIVGRSS